jgi:hypothetical protein
MGNILEDWFKWFRWEVIIVINEICYVIYINALFFAIYYLWKDWFVKPFFIAYDIVKWLNLLSYKK